MVPCWQTPSDLAIGQEQPAELKLRWHQFMLYPHFDRGGHDFLQFFRERYGNELRVPMWDSIRAVAEPVGISFAFEKMTSGPASIDGHRLVRWTERQKPGSATSLIEDISTSIFEKAQVIDNDFLARTAGRQGFDPALPPQQFAYSLLTRNQRISHDNLRLRDRQWLENVERWHWRNEAARNGEQNQEAASHPIFAPLQIRGCAYQTAS